MAWTLSSWLMSVRAFQLLGALAAAGLNGFLTASIYVKQLGLTQSMVILELMICTLLVYTTLAIILQRTGKRSRRKGWLICFIVFDSVFCAFDLAIITLLARAGLPDHCGGFTPDGFDENQAQEEYHRGYTTVGFSDGTAAEIGRLDRFCGFERSFFFIAGALIFTYILTIVLEALSVFDTNHVRQSKYKEVLENLRLEQAKSDVELETSPCPQEEAPRHSMPAPPSEGIITRTASLRSTLTSITSSTISHMPHRPHIIARRPVAQPTAPPLPHRRLSLTKPPSPGGPAFVPIPLDEDSAEAALVTDGMRPVSHSDSATGYVADGMLHGAQHRRGASATHGMPMLLEEVQTAESALVSDGMRPDPMLPPYEPGSSQMAGHGGESNDMRLSEYVKGQDRAQDMKDSGRY